MVLLLLAFQLPSTPPYAIVLTGFASVVVCRYVEDRRRIPELMTVVGHLSWLGMSQVVLASDVALVGQANSTYQAFEPSESVRGYFLLAYVVCSSHLNAPCCSWLLCTFYVVI